MDDPFAWPWVPWSPQQVAALFAGLDAPWCVVGGMAVDGWLDRTTRAHGDIEVAVPRADFPTVRARLAAYSLYIAADGRVLPLADGADFPAAHHQCWVFDGAARQWRLDVMLEPGDHATWVFRRDGRITAPRGDVVVDVGGVPVQAPEVVLLYKAKARRDKDEADFRACLPVLAPAQRRWLADALAVVHPGHPWEGALRA